MIRISRPSNVIVVVTTISDCERKPDDIKSWKCKEREKSHNSVEDYSSRFIS